MILLHKKITPIIKVISPAIDFMRLKNLVEEFLLEQSGAGFHRGRVIESLVISVNLESLLDDLRRYINRGSNHRLYIQSGYFYHHDIDHLWLQDNQLIIDIALGNVKDHPVIDKSLQADLEPFTYFMSDDLDHRLYKLYLPEIV
ncbi:TPA: hypothetical protein DF272_03675 [Candidatus Falkowbacteria bacterium]|nr:hypothetical protein [Candidatus Falkowbacteria bacterium]